jgi:hypothetical protein
MKQINVWFEDDEHYLLEKEKRRLNLTWKDFLLKLINIEDKEELEKFRKDQLKLLRDNRNLNVEVLNQFPVSNKERAR